MDQYHRFEGLFIPTVTPFTEQLTIDHKSLERVCSYQLGVDGVTGLVSCARIGEGTVLKSEEKYEVFEVMGNAARAAGKLHIATIAPQSTAEAIEMLDRLAKLPVDAVMVFPPLLFCWGKVGGDLKVRFWEDLSRASQLPLVLFQIPVENYWYDAPTIDRIAALPNVVAYKEASFNLELYTETCRLLKQNGRGMRVLTGNDRFVGKSYELGGRGALIGMANLAVDRWAALDRAGRAGDYEGALAIQEELHELSHIVFAEPIVEAVSRIKAILVDEGHIACAATRPPQMGIDHVERERVLNSYRALRASA